MIVIPLGFMLASRTSIWIWKVIMISSNINTAQDSRQAHTQGGFGGFNRTPLSAAIIHMNLYGTYVTHTPLIESRTRLY